MEVAFQAGLKQDFFDLRFNHIAQGWSAVDGKREITKRAEPVGNFFQIKAT